MVLLAIFEKGLCPHLPVYKTCTFTGSLLLALYTSTLGPNLYDARPLTGSPLVALCTQGFGRHLPALLIHTVLGGIDILCNRSATLLTGSNCLQTCSRAAARATSLWESSWWCSSQSSSSPGAST